jgi:hypothetical protein
MGMGFCSGEIVVNDGAVGRILAGWNFRRKRRIRVAVPADTNGILRREDVYVGFCNLLGDLAERSNVIENPERPAVGRDN